MSRRCVLLLALFLTFSCLGCDALFLHSQFVPVGGTSGGIFLEKDTQERLLTVLPVLQRSVADSDRFYANRLLIADVPECPVYFASQGPTWGILSLLMLVDSRRLQGLADFNGRTYAVVRKFGGMCLEDIVLHEKTHVYLADWTPDREVEEGVVLATGLLAKDAYFGGIRASVRNVLEDLSDDDLHRLAKGLGHWRPFNWGKGAEQRGCCASSLVDLVRREGGIVSVGLMLDWLGTGDLTPVAAAARSLALSEESLLDVWVSFLRREYLDPCDPELWSPTHLCGDRRRKGEGAKTKTYGLDFEALGGVAVHQLLGLVSERTVILSEQECEQLAGSAPLSPDAYLLLAKVHHDSGRLTPAREAWLTSWRLSGRPKNLAGRLPSGRLYAEQVRRVASGPGPKLPADLLKTRWALAAAWCVLADCPTLAALLCDAEETKDSQPSFDVRIHAAVMQGDVEEAEQLASQAMGRFPETERFRYYLAWLHYRRDDAPGARRVLADDDPWPEDSEWSELRNTLLSRLSQAEAPEAPAE